MKCILVLCSFLLTIVVFCEGISDTPLCNSCTCLIKENKLLIDCSKSGYNVIKKFYEEANFINASQNNTLYEIYSLDLNGIPFIHLSQVIPASSLRILNLSNTDITEIVPGAFQNLQAMIELSLGHNRIEDLNANTFKGIQTDGKDYPLKQLKILRLNNNRLVSINNDAFQHIEETLEELYLQGNGLSVLDLPTTQAITGIVHLRVLDLSDNGFSTLPDGFLHTPAFLEELYLSNNAITDIKSLGLELSQKLKKLVLDENPIVNLTQKSAFPKLPYLEVLHMCNMPNLELIDNHTMCELTALQELHMSNNQKLHTIGEMALIRLENGLEIPVIQTIKKLCLSNNQLTRLDLQLNWDAITELDINGNPWTCEYENQWMVDTLIPIYCKLNKEKCESLKCAAPIEMENRTFYELHELKYTMRRLDYYGNHPENDGVYLVWLMFGLLIGITVVLGIGYFWKHHWFGIFDSSPAAYSRQFYGRTSSIPDDYHP